MQTIRMSGVVVKHKVTRKETLDVIHFERRFCPKEMCSASFAVCKSHQTIWNWDESTWNIGPTARNNVIFTHLLSRELSPHDSSSHTKSKLARSTALRL